MSEDGAPGVIWEADSTNPEKSAEVRDALRRVMDPELGLSVIELGLVRDLTIKDSGQHVKMIMTTPFCPYGPALLESTRAKAEEATGEATTIEMAMDAWDPSMMEDGAGAEEAVGGRARGGRGGRVRPGGRVELASTTEAPLATPIGAPQHGPSAGDERVEAVPG